jgi:uncharacterized membrane protein
LANQSGSYIEISIAHTARTWGNDIESLLTGHISSFIKPESKFKQFIYKQSGWIGFTFGSLFFLITLFGAYLTVNKFVALQMSTAQDFLRSEISVSDKVTYLIQAINQGAWPRFQYALLLFIFISLVIAVFLGAWVNTSAENHPRSFLLLSREAEEDRSRHLEKRKRKWLVFAISIIVSIISGIISNFIFAYMFSK